MPRPFSEAHKRASELIHLPLERMALIPALAFEFKTILDDRQQAEERALTAEKAAVDALQYANACEKAAWEWKRKLDAVTAQLEEERDWFEVSKQAHASVRQKAIEEAAQLCDRQGRVWGILRTLEATHKARAAAELSSNLRALTSQPEPEKEPA